MSKHTLVRVHMNGVYKMKDITDSEIKSMKNEIDAKYGDGLFIDGVCIKQGYLSGEQVRNWTKRIALM